MNISDLLASPQYPAKYILQKLLMEYMKISREQMRTDWETEIPEDVFNKIIVWYKAYVEDQKPLEYILWHVTFFWNEFIVDENTLVPRPETEYMVQAISEYVLDRFGQESDSILMDIGTWCWVLWTSVLLQNSNNFTTVFFTDISQEALLVAKKMSTSYFHPQSKRCFSFEQIY